MLNGVVGCEKSDVGDYDNDGIPDMMVKFDREHVTSLLEPADEVVITVEGLAGSVRFVGTDVIRVIDEGKTKVKNSETLLIANTGYVSDNAESKALYYFHGDHLGTPQAITDENGNVVWKADYKPFGEVTLTTSAVENNFRFPGQFYDAETGLHYNYFRYYDPGVGRYLRSDPIGLEGGMNLYTYVSDNPIDLYDIRGLEECGKCGVNSIISIHKGSIHDLMGVTYGQRIETRIELKNTDCYNPKCCEAKQLIRGYKMTNGKRDRFESSGSHKVISRNNYVDDGINFELSGSTLIGRDDPAIKFRPKNGLVTDVRMEFKVEVYDTCRGSKKVAEKEGHWIRITSKSDYMPWEEPVTYNQGGFDIY